MAEGSDKQEIVQYLTSNSSGLPEAYISLQTMLASGALALVVGVITSQTIVFICRRSERLAAVNRRYHMASRKMPHARWLPLTASALAAALPLNSFPSAYGLVRLVLTERTLPPPILTFYSTQHLVGFVGFWTTVTYGVGHIAAAAWYWNDDSHAEQKQTTK